MIDWKTFLDERLPGVERLAVLEVGSTAHGTALDGADDFDCMVVWLETLDQVFDVRTAKQRKMVRTKPEGERSEPCDIDAQVYTFRAWLNLALKGNPSVLQTLWCPVLEESSDVWTVFRSIGDQFVGHHLLAPYMGYMESQKRRILGEQGGGHGRRGSGGREELIDAHGYDTKFAMHAARLGFQCLELLSTRSLVLPMEGEAGEWLRAVRRGEVSFDDWLKRVDSLRAECYKAARHGSLANGPNIDVLVRMSRELHVDRPAQFLGSEGSEL